MLIQLSINSYLNTKFKEIIKEFHHIKNCLKFFASFRGSVRGCCSCSTESFPSFYIIPNDVDKIFVIGLECRVDNSDFKRLKKDFEFIFQNLKKGMELVQPTKEFKPKYHIADNL